MEQISLWDMFDHAMAEQLGVDVQTYVDTIDKFNDEDMGYIIETILKEDSTEEDKQKAKELFKTNL